MTKEKIKVKVKDYNADSLRKLAFPHSIRKRPGVYVGGVTADTGLFRIFKEAVDNSVDEATNGHGKVIFVSYNSKSQVFIVADRGRGIPTGMNKKEKKSGLEIALTDMHGSGKFDQDSYASSSGLNGLGLKALVALSEYTTAWSANEGVWKSLTLKRGIIQGGLTKAKPVLPFALEKVQGTVVEWKPDVQIFGTEVVRIERIHEEIKNLAMLNPGLEFIVRIDGKEKKYVSENGLLDMVYGTKEQQDTALTKPFHFQKKGVIDIAVVWNDDDLQQTWSYVNSSHTPEEGTHVQGARNALLEALRAEVDAKAKTDKKPAKSRGRGKSKDDGTIDAKYLLMGIRMAMNYRMANPVYSGQTKDKLTNAEVTTQVKNLVLPEFSQFLKKNPKLVSTLIDRAKKFQKASEKFHNDLKAVKSISLSAPGTRGLLPGKLAQATGKYKPEEIELFLVEGDSAAGPAKESKLPWQEVLALKGKILNAARADLAQVLNSQEVMDIITSIGAKPGDDCKTHGGSVRIGRISIMTDADSDGKHICSLLIALFTKYFRPWIEEGRIGYIQLPLFVGALGDHKEFGFSLDEMLKKFPEAKRKSVTVNRLKGLGEMTNSELYTYGLDPRTRKIHILSLNDADAAEVNLVMGQDVAYRKEFLGIQAREVA